MSDMADNMEDLTKHFVPYPEEREKEARISRNTGGAEYEPCSELCSEFWETWNTGRTARSWSGSQRMNEACPT